MCIERGFMYVQFQGLSQQDLKENLACDTDVSDLSSQMKDATIQ